jgi:hypothetical protein
MRVVADEAVPVRRRKRSGLVCIQRARCFAAQAWWSWVM